MNCKKEETIELNLEQLLVAFTLLFMCSKKLKARTVDILGALNMRLFLYQNIVCHQNLVRVQQRRCLKEMFSILKSVFMRMFHFSLPFLSTFGCHCFSLVSFCLIHLSYVHIYYIYIGTFSHIANTTAASLCVQCAYLLLFSPTNDVDEHCIVRLLNRTFICSSQQILLSPRRCFKS